MEKKKKNKDKKIRRLYKPNKLNKVTNKPYYITADDAEFLAYEADIADILKFNNR